MAATALVAACGDPTGLDSLREPMDPPRTYLQWWSVAQTCSERVGTFSRIRWFVTDGFPGRPHQLGQWNSRHEITIRVDALFNGPVVQHEMLHELLGGDPEHLDPAWEACALPTGVG